MKACVLHRPAPVMQRPLQFMDVPPPVPRQGEVLIKLRACAVCRTDLHVVEGELPQRKMPLIPGHQVVGEVVQAGSTDRSPESGLPLRINDRVGVAWLNRTCGVCRFCTSGRENLCEQAEFTGWTCDGGYAQFIAAPAAFVYRLPPPEQMSDLHIAPLLCAGIIGYRCLRLTGLGEILTQRAGPSSAQATAASHAQPWSGLRLGIYGFGAAGHIAIQIARARGARVYVFTRDQRKHQVLAEELGAAWVGGTTESPPVKLDASIIFAPAGEIVPAALQALDRGGRLVLGGIHMSPIPKLNYEWLYHERIIRSVANNTRQDGREFLAEAARLGLKTSVQTFPLEQANDALIALKHDAIKGAAVLVVDGRS